MGPHQLRPRLRRLPLRVRLVLAATALLPLALGGVFGLVFLRFESAVNSGLDADLRSRAEALAPLIARSGPAAILSRSGERLLVPQGAFAQVLDGRGRVLASSRQVASVALLDPSDAARATLHGYRSERPDVPTITGRSRLLALPVGTRRAVVVGRSVKGRERANESFARALLIGGPLSLLLAAAACYLAAASALRPVDEMRKRAEQISADGSGARLPIPPADDEISRLGHTLNAMLGRLEHAHAQQRILVQNASHELRTPLSTLAAEIELALNDPNAAASTRTAMTRALEEAHRVTRLADDLLILAQVEEHGVPLSRELTDIGDTVHETANRFIPIASELHRTIAVTGGPVVAEIDPLRLQQAIGNLIDNALRHGKGDITIELLPHGDTFEISVHDQGPGIDPAIADTAFDRFVRGNTTASGSGLGLAIVLAIARAHDGTIAHDRSGAIVLRLPTGVPTPRPENDSRA